MTRTPNMSQRVHRRSFLATALPTAVFGALLALTTLAAAPTATARGTLTVRDGDSTRPLETAYVHVAVSIDERLARTTLTQVFVNNTDSDLEGVYEFPLPRDAAVANFAVWHDGVRVDAEVREKDEAREEYDESAAEGERPALVEGTRDGAFRMDVFAIPAGGSKRVELVYTEVLDYSAGVVSWVFPAQFRRETAGDIGLFDVDIDVAAPDEIAFVGSPSWPSMKVIENAGGVARLALTVEHLQPTRDVDLVFGVETTPFGFSAKTHRAADDAPGHFQLGFAFNRDDAPGDRPPREIVFAVDTSLSMAGAPLERARRVVREVLAELPDGDAVNVVAFDSVLQSLFERSEPADSDNRHIVDTFVGGLRAHRGSDFGLLLDAMPELFPLTPGAEERERVLVLLTDGQPTLGELDDDKLAAAARTRLERDLPIETVVVHLGYPSRRAVLEHVAPDATYHYVPDGAAGDGAVEDIVHELTTAALHDVTIRVEGGLAMDMHPSKPRTLFAGRQLLVHGRYQPAPFGLPAKVVIEGTLHGRRRTFEHLVALPTNTDDRDAAIAREWAKSEVRGLLRLIDLEKNDERRADMVSSVKALGKEHRLVTPYTSFLAKRPAHLSLERFKPGDPELYVEAPRSAHRVVAILPWGETIPCRWLEDQGRWMGRFLVPRGTPDGVYRIRVVVVGQGGERDQHVVFYRVDGTAPQMRLELPELLTPGTSVTVRAVPVEHVFEGKGPRTTVRADVRRAIVRLGDRSVVLRRSSDGAVWSAKLAVPEDMAGASARVTLVVSDWAANSYRVQRRVRFTDAR